MKRERIWVIEDGSYSDYHVIGVFSSEKNANIVRAKVGGEVAEWPLDPAVNDINSGRKYWNVLILRDGSIERCLENEPSQYNLGGEVDLWERTKAPAYQGKGIPDALHCMVWATNKKHAIKIANEYRAQWIALGKWK